MKNLAQVLARFYQALRAGYVGDAESIARRFNLGTVYLFKIQLKKMEQADNWEWICALNGVQRATYDAVDAIRS